MTQCDSMDTITFQLLSPFQAPKWQALTFPRYRPLLASAGIEMVAVGASCGGGPIGLALARLGGAGLLSLFVSRDFRRRGTGNSLLERLEVSLAERGCRAVSTVWMSGSAGARSFALLLHRRQWSAPERRMVVYRSTFDRLADAQWIHAFSRLPDGFAITPWARLKPQQLTALRQSIRFERWIPSDLNPFDFAGAGIDGAPAEPALSLACTYWDDVVGWSFAHRTGDLTARISCTFVRPDLQAHLLMLALWRETLMCQRNTAYQTVSWAVAATRPGMVEFNDRYMMPHVTERQETWGSEKPLS